MKWRELRRKAVKKGWIFVRHGSKHDIYENPDTGEQIQIGRHDSEEVRTGLYHSLKKKIGF